MSHQKQALLKAVLNPPAISSVSTTSPAQFNNFNFSLGLCVQTNIRQHSFHAGESMPQDHRWQIQLTICPAFSMTRHIRGQSWTPKALTKGNVLLLYFFSEEDFWDSNKRAQIHAGFHYSSESPWKAEPMHAAVSTHSLLCQQTPPSTGVSAPDPPSSFPQTAPLHACQSPRTELRRELPHLMRQMLKRQTHVQNDLLALHP